MLRFALVALAALLTLPAAHAQTSFGVRAGLNVSDYSGSLTDGIDPSPKLGFTGGAFAHVPLGVSGVFVQPEVSYSQKGAKTSNGDATLSVDYVEAVLPIGFAVPVTETGLTLGAYAGPAYAFKVRESGQFGGVALGTDVFENDFGAAVGATVGAGPFAVDGRYTLGLTPTYDGVGELRNGVFSIAGTYRF